MLFDVVIWVLAFFEKTTKRSSHWRSTQKKWLVRVAKSSTTSPSQTARRRSCLTAASLSPSAGSSASRSSKACPRRIAVFKWRRIALQRGKYYLVVPIDPFLLLAQREVGDIGCAAAVR